MSELAEKGTVFHRHYTVAPSTFMAFTSMTSGKIPYETDRKYYRHEPSLNGSTLFDQFSKQGYSCHIAWDTFYTDLVREHFKAEGLQTTIHTLFTIREAPHPHKKGIFDDLSKNEEHTEEAMQVLEDLFKEVSKDVKPVVFWLHIPHVIYGQNGYGSDIEKFDDIIGLARMYFSDDEISFSADHGHMNGWRGKYNYGFDTHDSAIRIPLVTPRIEGKEQVDTLTSNVDVFRMLTEKKIINREYIISDTAYYVQPNRKIAIIRDNYKFTYDKKKNRFGLFDLSWDPEENHNLYYAEYYDVDREIWSPLNQRIFYPESMWKEAHTAGEKLEEYFRSIWRMGSWREETFEKLLYRAKAYYRKFATYRKNRKRK